MVTEAPEEEWLWREDCIKALCACRHAKHSVWGGRGAMKDHVIAARDMHKAAPTARWDQNQMCRISLLRTAYRDQLPSPFSPPAPLINPFTGLPHGRTPMADFVERYADSFITWTGEYKPFGFHKVAA
jgi:hypothetical protein